MFIVPATVPVPSEVVNSGIQNVTLVLNKPSNLNGEIRYIH